MPVASTGRISITTSRRTAHWGICWRCRTMPFWRAWVTSGAVSRASTALNTLRPMASRRSGSIGSLRDGPRSPDTWASTAGTPSRSSTPCSPTVRGTIRCTSWPSALGAPGFDPRLILDRVLHGPRQHQRRRALTVGEGDHHRPAQHRPPEVSEHDRRVEPMGKLVAQLADPGVAPAATTGGGEHDRALGVPGGEHTGEFQQCGGGRQRRPGGSLGGVPVGDDHDRRRAGGARAHRHHVGEGLFAFDRLGVEVVHVDREAPSGGPSQGFDVFRHHLGHAPVAVAPGPPLGERLRQVVQARERGGPLEGVRRQVRPQGARTGPE